MWSKSVGCEGDDGPRVDPTDGCSAAQGELSTAILVALVTVLVRRK
jgi:hypothetical protein